MRAQRVANPIGLVPMVKQAGKLTPHAQVCTSPVLFVLAMACFLLAATAGAVELGGVDISVQPPPNRDNRPGASNGTLHGYIEIRVTLRNLSAGDRTVHLHYPPEAAVYRSPEGVSLSRTVRVAAGQQTSVSLFQPPLEAIEGALEVRVDGESERRVLPCESPRGWRSYSYGSSPDEPTILLSRGVPQEFRDRKEWNPAETPGGTATTYGSTSTTSKCTFLRSDVEANQWTANWLGYSCYDAVLLTADEFEGMSPPLQAALRRYAECGGQVLVHGRGLPSVLSDGGEKDEPPPAGAPWWTGCHVGLGYVAASGSSDWNAAARLLTKAVLAVPVYKPEEKPSDVYELLIGEMSVPVRGLFVLVLLFTVGIGPVNVWILSRYRKRIWLWWNVPAVSLLTCLAVFCYAVLAEGWTPQAKVASLTVLDQRCHRATTIGLFSCYCPLTPSGGLRFGVDTDVAPLRTEGTMEWARPYGRSRWSGLRFVDWTSDQHLAAGWVTARVPAYFQVRKSEDRRERLLVRKDAQGNLWVSNALGADIRGLSLADASGRLFRAYDLPAGSETKLEAVGGPPASGTGKVAAAGTPTVYGGRAAGTGLSGLRSLFLGGTDAWLRAFRSYVAADLSGSTYVGRKVSYMAVLASSPFMETPLAGARSEDTAAIVIGVDQE